MIPVWQAWVTGRMVVFSIVIKKQGSREGLRSVLGALLMLAMLILRWSLDIHEEIPERQVEIFCLDRRRQVCISRYYLVKSIFTYILSPVLVVVNSGFLVAGTMSYSVSFKKCHLQFALTGNLCRKDWMDLEIELPKVATACQGCGGVCGNLYNCWPHFKWFWIKTGYTGPQGCQPNILHQDESVYVQFLFLYRQCKWHTAEK